MKYLLLLLAVGCAKEDERVYAVTYRTYSPVTESCCECLIASTRTDRPDTVPCTTLDLKTCDDPATMVWANCNCWEQCYEACLAPEYDNPGTGGYPYNEPPNGCCHFEGDCE